MYRFFVEPAQIQEHTITITGNDVNHIKNVLRMKKGEELWISDQEEKEYHCYIEEFLEEEILTHIMYVQEPGFELPGRIYLFQGLPKGEKMEWIIQKAVELGVHEIIPVSMKRCVVKLDKKKAEKKTARWQQIAESAAKQSKRMKIPRIHPVCTYGEALEYADESCQVRLVPYERTEGMKETKEMIEQIEPGQSIGIFIGPEGGFDEKEIEAALQAGMKPISLGKRILRTETAGMTILSVLMFHLETC